MSCEPIPSQIEQQIKTLTITENGETFDDIIKELKTIISENGELQ